MLSGTTCPVSLLLITKLNNNTIISVVPYPRILEVIQQISQYDCNIMSPEPPLPMKVNKIMSPSEISP